MSVPDVVPHPAAPAPAVVVGAAILAFVGALPMLYLALIIYALAGEGSSDGTGGGNRLWALLPLVAAVAQVWGGVRLLRGRGWRLLAVACLPATAFVGWLVVQSTAAGEPPPLGLLLMVLISPVVALGLTLTPRVRHWSAGR